MVNFNARDPVVILGFSQMGQVILTSTVSFDTDSNFINVPFGVIILPHVQVLANFLSTPLASGVDGDLSGWPYIAFDLNPSVVKVGDWGLSFSVGLEMTIVIAIINDKQYL